uniref:ATP synthase protein MI25 n=1 Tax=Welwitschia mirabilis TaxID=3377 RepID=A0A8H2SF11_WELMI|nr:ATP synthase subunit 4 [Welwitschia mirabilis]
MRSWRVGNQHLAAILLISVCCSKGILILNEETIVACCFIGFTIFSQRSLGSSLYATLDGRRAAIQRELQQLLNPLEVVKLESNEQQNNLRICLRSLEPEIVSSLLGIARCAPKCHLTVQAVLCRNLAVELATLNNAISARRTRLRDDLVTGFQFSVTERFCPPCTTSTTKQCDTAIVLLIREGLLKVSRMALFPRGG